MTAKRESAFTELFDLVKQVRDDLRARGIDIPSLSWGIGALVTANQCFWIAIVWFAMATNPNAPIDDMHDVAKEFLLASAGMFACALVLLFCALPCAQEKRCSL